MVGENSSLIKIGATVKIKFRGEEKMEIKIIPKGQEKGSDNEVQSDTPFARAIMGKREGEEVTFEVVAKAGKYINKVEIVEIT